jgi:hypothetical protein
MVVGVDVELQKSGNTIAGVVGCRRAYTNMRVGAAAKASKHNPSTNRPVVCPWPGCGQVVWAYSMVHHQAEVHRPELVQAYAAFHTSGGSKEVFERYDGVKEKYSVSWEEYQAVLHACGYNLGTCLNKLSEEKDASRLIQGINSSGMSLYQHVLAAQEPLEEG